jgi:hypothetical protein
VIVFRSPFSALCQALSFPLADTYDDVEHVCDVAVVTNTAKPSSRIEQ